MNPSNSVYFEDASGIIQTMRQVTKLCRRDKQSAPVTARFEIDGEGSSV